MALPTSVLGMGAIQTEFGGSNPIALSEYYGVNANVASSGQIRMAQFLGISNYAASTPNFSIGDFAISPQNASADFYLMANGQYQVYEGGTRTATGTWKTGGGTGANYDCRLTRTSGTSGGTHNTWVNLATDQGWSWTESRDGFYSTSMGGHLEIRVASGATLDNSSFSVQLDVEV